MSEHDCKNKRNLLDNNRLSSKNYYHPDSWSLVAKSDLISNTSMKKNNNLSQLVSFSFPRFSSNVTKDNSKSIILPSLYLNPETNKSSNSSKNLPTIHIETEPNPNNTTFDNTVNEVLLSLQPNSNKNETMSLNPEYFNEFSNRSSVQKHNLKLYRSRNGRSNSNKKNLKQNINDRLNYLQIANPTPETKLQKNGVASQKNLSSMRSFYNESFYSHSKIFMKESIRKLASSKTKTFIKNRFEIKNSSMAFFSKLDIDLFIEEFLKNLDYLERIKNNRRIVAGIIKGFLEYTTDIGDILLNPDRSETRKKINEEIIKEKIALNPNNPKTYEKTQNNEEIFDIEKIMKLYYFNLSLQKFIELYHQQSSNFDNEKYLEDFHIFQKNKKEYLFQLKQKKSKKYPDHHDLIHKNEINSNQYSQNLLTEIENLENSIGSLPYLSQQTRMACKYANQLVDGRKKPIY